VGFLVYDGPDHRSSDGGSVDTIVLGVGANEANEEAPTSHPSARHGFRRRSARSRFVKS
jgi:hypothetical protein